LPLLKKCEPSDLRPFFTDTNNKNTKTQKPINSFKPKQNVGSKENDRRELLPITKTAHKKKKNKKKNPSNFMQRN
jgi:hypothetical protein